MFKNTAAKFIVFAFDATTGLPKTGDTANITCYVGKDYGAATVLTDTSATQIDATNAPGYYLFDAAQAETNADCLHITGKSSTSNIVVVGAPAVIYTRPQTGWLAPTTAGRTLDISAGGEAGIDWANIGSPTTVVDLSNSSVSIASNIKKNQALTAFEFLMTDSTNHAPAPSKAVTVTRSVNGGAFIAGALSAVTDLSNGIYKVDFAASDLNGNVVVLRAVASGCDDTFERIITQP